MMIYDERDIRIANLEREYRELRARFDDFYARISVQDKGLASAQSVRGAQLIDTGLPNLGNVTTPASFTADLTWSANERDGVNGLYTTLSELTSVLNGYLITLV